MREIEFKEIKECLLRLYSEVETLKHLTTNVIFFKELDDLATTRVRKEWHTCKWYHLQDIWEYS